MARPNLLSSENLSVVINRTVCVVRGGSPVADLRVSAESNGLSASVHISWKPFVWHRSAVPHSENMGLFDAFLVGLEQYNSAYFEYVVTIKCIASSWLGFCPNGEVFVC